MKKILSSLLIMALLATVIVSTSATQTVPTASMQLNDQSIALVIGGGFWCSFAFFSWSSWMGVAVGFAGFTAGVSVGVGLAIGAVAFVTEQLVC